MAKRILLTTKRRGLLKQEIEFKSHGLEDPLGENGNHSKYSLPGNAHGQMSLVGWPVRF